MRTRKPASIVITLTETGNLKLPLGLTINFVPKPRSKEAKASAKDVGEQLTKLFSGIAE